VTTTVSQQNGASILGLPLTDWISAITAVVVAFFAGVTVWEGIRNRRKESIEKQLEKLYNPMFEIMDEALERQTVKEKETGIVRLGSAYDNKLRQIFFSYGHYLDPIVHDRMKELLNYPDREIAYPVGKFTWCHLSVSAARDRLLSELYALEGKRWRPIKQWPKQTLDLLEQMPPEHP
jgi:hypothetical protein